jgi:hypothetical protein
MEDNRDFFSEKKEYIINVTDTSPVNLFFGAVGCRYHVLNDVIVIPHGESKVTIEFVFGDNKLFGSDNLLVVETDKAVNIYQREVEPYPSIELNVNDVKYKKFQTWEGVLKITGNCDVIQKPSYIYDR